MECSTTGIDNIQEMGQYQAENRPMPPSDFGASAMFQTAVRSLDQIVVLEPLAGHFD